MSGGEVIPVLVAAVGTENDSQTIEVALGRQATSLADDGITVSGSSWRRGSYYFLGWSLERPLTEETGEVCRYYFASALAKFVLRKASTDLLQTVLEEECQGYLERAAVERRSRRLLRRYGFLGEFRESNVVYAETLVNLLDWFEIHREIVIDGYLRFRTEGLREVIRALVSKARRECQRSREYLELAELLRYFLKTQPPKVPKVHIVLGENGAFHLLDKEGRYMEIVYKGYEDESTWGDDLLIASLLTMLPRRLVVHGESEEAVVDTMEEIFEGRISYCHGCRLCH